MLAHVGPYPDHTGLFVALLLVGLAAAWRLFGRETRRHHARILEIVDLGVRLR